MAVGDLFSGDETKGYIESGGYDPRVLGIHCKHVDIKVLSIWLDLRGRGIPSWVVLSFLASAKRGGTMGGLATSSS